MNGWTKAWLLWIAGSGISFGVLEYLALKVPGASLSEHTRTAFGFDGRGRLIRLRRVMFVLGWGWFGLHIWSKTSGCVFPDTPPMPPS